MASELEQLRDENRRLREAAITVIDRVGRAGVQGWTMGQFLDDGSVRELVEALAQPAPSPADVWDHNYICSRGTVCDRCGIGPNSHGYKGQPKQP